MAQQNRKWRHHYVPELTLREFTDDQGLLHYVDRSTNERRPATIPRNLGYLRDFYYLNEKEDPNVLEDAFMTLEGAAAGVLDRIIELRRVPTETEDWIILMNFVAIQAVRVPSTKTMIARPIQREREIITNMIRQQPGLFKRNAQMLRINPETVSCEQFLAMKDEQIIEGLSNREFFDYSMSMAQPILESINQRLWTVVHSDRAGEHFVVSDDPVTLYWSDGIRRAAPPGYGHANADVTVPLSSEVALVLTYQDFTVRESGVRHQVARINSRTIAASRHFVAAKRESVIYYSSEGIVETSELTAAPVIPPIVL